MNKIEGQMRGISKMVEAERDCEDILIQLAAVNSAMQSIASMVIKDYASICSQRHADTTDMASALTHAVSIWEAGASRVSLRQICTHTSGASDSHTGQWGLEHGSTSKNRQGTFRS